MSRALRHTIFSAIINPEATATFLFLPSWDVPMTLDHYSTLLAAYPHICCALGTFPSTDLHYDAPQFRTNNETPLQQHTWNMHIVTVWSAYAKRRLNNLSPTWIQDLAQNTPEAHWHLTNISNDPIINDKQADVGPGFSKFFKLPTDKTLLINSPNNPAVNEEAPAPNQSHPHLELKIHNWKPWAYNDGSCSAFDGKQVIKGGVYQPGTNNIDLVEPNGQGLTNTIGRAELASIASALTHGYTHIAKDSLASLHQKERRKKRKTAQEVHHSLHQFRKRENIGSKSESKSENSCCIL